MLKKIVDGKSSMVIMSLVTVYALIGVIKLNSLS